MTYYDSLPSGDYLTAFLLICLPASLFPSTFMLLLPVSKAKAITLKSCVSNPALL